MIKHIVMWSFKDEAEGNTKEQNILIFKEMLESLVGKVPGLLSLEVGVKGVDSPVDNQDVVLTTTHNTWDELKAYAIHPEHLKVGAFAKQVVLSRSAVDYVI